MQHFLWEQHVCPVGGNMSECYMKTMTKGCREDALFSVVSVVGVFVCLSTLSLLNRLRYICVFLCTIS